MTKEKRIIRLIANATINIAVKSVDRASSWFKYQPKEPEELRKYMEGRKEHEKRKVSATIIFVVLLVGMLSVTASAMETTPNTGDEPISFYFEASSVWRFIAWRNKTNNSSVYIKLANAPSDYTSCHVQGGVGTWSDNSNVTSVSYETYGSSSPVTVRIGKWRIRQTVYEHGKNKARLQFFPNSTYGVVEGSWSPDCAGSYPAVN